MFRLFYEEIYKDIVIDTKNNSHSKLNVRSSIMIWKEFTIFICRYPKLSTFFGAQKP